MTLGRERQDLFELGTSFSTWLNTDQCRPVQSSWMSSPQLLGLPAMRTAFETNMRIMTHQGKHGLLRKPENRLWTERQVYKGSCRQLYLNQAESFTFETSGLG